MAGDSGYPSIQERYILRGNGQGEGLGEDLEESLGEGLGDCLGEGLGDGLGEGLDGFALAIRVPNGFLCVRDRFAFTILVRN